jgi:talin
LANLVEPLADGAIGFASKLPGGSEKQAELLDSARTICESASNLVLATKDAGGNPKAINFHPPVDEAAEDLVEAVKDLTQQLEEAAAGTGAVSALVDSINRARTGVNMFVADYRERHPKTARHVSEPESSFVEHQDSMVKQMMILVH